MTQQPIISTVEQLYEARSDTCAPAREWLAAKGITTLAEAWDQCQRSDWMLWLDDALDLLTDRERRLIACRCVRDTPLSDGRKTWDLLTDDRSRQVVEVAERHAHGDATDEQLAAAWSAARAAAWTAARVAERVAKRAAADERAATWAATEAAAAAARTAAGAASRVAKEARATADAADAAARAAAWTAERVAKRAAADEQTVMWAATVAAEATAARAVARAARDAARAAQADLIREIVGNPWRDERRVRR